MEWVGWKGDAGCYAGTRYPERQVRLRKLTVVLAVWAGLAGGVEGADLETGERLLFPRNSVRGYVDFQVAPRQSEIDLGLCTVKRDNPYPEFLGCNGYARYAWGGYVELQPVGRGPLRRLFIFLEPAMYAFVLNRVIIGLNNEGVDVAYAKYVANMIGVWEVAFDVPMRMPSGNLPFVIAVILNG